MRERRGARKVKRGRSMKRKHRALPAIHGSRSQDGTAALTGVSAKGAVGKMHHGEAQVVGRFLGLHGLFSPFADAVRAAKESPAALDNLAAYLKALFELDSAAKREWWLRRYRSAPPGEKAAIRKAAAALLGITEESFVREARRFRVGAPGKPGRPKREK